MAERFQGEWAPSIKITDEAFEPLALALGQLTLAWNDLHLSLGLLFCIVMEEVMSGISLPYGMPFP